MNEKVGVVFESLSSTELCEVCAQFVDFQSCDVARKVLDVRSDIAQTTRGACSIRIVSSGLVLLCGLQGVRSPALRVFGDDFKNLAQFSTTHHFASLLHHWVPCIAVGHREDLL